MLSLVSLSDYVTLGKMAPLFVSHVEDCCLMNKRTADIISIENICLPASVKRTVTLNVVPVIVLMKGISKGIAVVLLPNMANR